jgi:hypothetical protein
MPFLWWKKIGDKLLIGLKQCLKYNQTVGHMDKNPSNNDWREGQDECQQGHM